jgi:hypothetical protein
MRQDTARWLSALACLSAVALPGRANATVTWTATFEKGDLSEWRPGINGTQPNGTRKNVEVLGEQVYTGKFAGKITCHPDDTFTFGQNRVDINHPTTLAATGKEIWISGHYMMPEDAKVRNEIAFFESNSSNLNAMDFWVQPKMGGGTSIVFGNGDLGRTVVWTGDFKPGAWHQVAIHVLFSQSATVGTIDVWFDGAQVVTNYKGQTMRDGNSLYFQTGLHRRAVAQVTDVLYLDDFLEGDSLADIKIAAPTGGDGGVVADASGTGAGGGGGAGGSGGAAAMDGGAGAGGATGSGGAMGSGGAGGATGAGTGGATGAGTGGATITGTGTGSTTSGTGTAGTNSSGTTTSATTSATSGAAGATGATPNDSMSGCSCSVLAAVDGTQRWGALGLMLGIATLARRRRRAL